MALAWCPAWSFVMAKVALPPRVSSARTGGTRPLSETSGCPDVIATWLHERSRMLARTGGGGLSLIDSPTELRAEIALPDTSDGRDAGELGAAPCAAWAQYRRKGDPGNALRTGCG